jgi:hypothetical protein
MDYVNITEFNGLNNDEKAWYLWHGAAFLSVYEKAGYRINLFHLNDYYIELWYNISDNKVDHIRAFRTLDLLDPFLDNINIDSVLNSSN